MSKWTHIAGLVRIDYIGHLIEPFTPFGEKQIIDVFKESMPIGSEGPPWFHVNKWPTRDIVHFHPSEDETAFIWEGSTYWGDLSISGDLRDFGSDEDVKNVVSWFQKACATLQELYTGTMIRQAILQIQPEYDPSTLVSWQGGNYRWLTIKVEEEEEE